MCSFSAWYLLLLAHSFWMLLEASFRADLTCWMNVLKFKIRQRRSHHFLCHPYRSWKFHDHIKDQCPGVTVLNGRRFRRALIYKVKPKLLICSIHCPSYFLCALLQVVVWVCSLVCASWITPKKTKLSAKSDSSMNSKDKTTYSESEQNQTSFT